MKRIFIIITCILPLIGFGQNEPSNQADHLSKNILICEWDTIEVILPSGWKSEEMFEYMEGFIQTYQYADGSSISVLCGSNALLSLEEGVLNSRKIIVRGHEVTYNHVSNVNRKRFDLAFDLMEF